MPHWLIHFQTVSSGAGLSITDNPCTAAAAANVRNVADDVGAVGHHRQCHRLSAGAARPLHTVRSEPAVCCGGNDGHATRSECIHTDVRSRSVRQQHAAVPPSADELRDASTSHVSAVCRPHRQYADDVAVRNGDLHRRQIGAARSKRAARGARYRWHIDRLIRLLRHACRLRTLIRYKILYIVHHCAYGDQPLYVYTTVSHNSWPIQFVQDGLVSFIFYLFKYQIYL